MGLRGKTQFGFRFCLRDLEELQQEVRERHFARLLVLRIELVLLRFVATLRCHFRDATLKIDVRPLRMPNFGIPKTRMQEELKQQVLLGSTGGKDSSQLLLCIALRVFFCV